MTSKKLLEKYFSNLHLPIDAIKSKAIILIFLNYLFEGLKLVIIMKWIKLYTKLSQPI